MNNSIEERVMPLEKDDGASSKFKCVMCGELFSANAHNAKYCSKRCTNSSRRVKKVKKNCFVCKKIFASTEKGAEYCSEECMKLYYRHKRLENKPLIGNVKKRCRECHNDFYGSYKTFYCSKRCYNRRNSRVGSLRRRKRLQRNGYVDESITLDKLIERDSNECHICGKECDSNDYENVRGSFIAGEAYPSIDHVLPISKGGVHQWSNVKLAHHRCNTIKGNNTSNDLETAAE